MSEALPALIQRALAERRAGRPAASLDIFQAASAMQPAHPGLRLESAFDLRALGRVAEAAVHYRAVLDAHPDHVGAMLGLGLCARDRGDGAAALDWLQRARAADPDHLAAALEMAAEQRRRGQLDEAEAGYAQVLERHPGQVAALLGRALCARQRGDRAGARAWLEQALQAEPSHLGARLELAAELREMGEPDAARAELEILLASHAGHPAALLQLGLVERAAGRTEAALAAFTRAHDGQPARADLLVHMAVEHRTLGEPDACERLLARAYDLAPGDVSVAVQRAEHARMANDVPRMHAIYAAAATAQPGALPLELGLAEARLLLGRAGEALDRLAQLEAAAEDGVPIRLKRVSILRRMGLLRPALLLARQATDTWPGSHALWAERILCESVAGDAGALALCWASAPAHTNRERARLLRLRAGLHEEEGERDTALALLDEADALDPVSGEGPFMVTRVALGALDLPRARAALLRYAGAARAVTKLRGRSSKPGQTHFGQLLDEFTLDAAGMERLLATRNLAEDTRVAAVLRCVAGHPGSTAAAMELMAALRAGGLVGLPARPTRTEAAQAAVSDSPIPRAVVQFWDRSPPPPEVGDMMRSWTDENPGFAYRLFDAASARAFIVDTYGARAGAVFGRAVGAAQQADLFRLGYLAASGGVYADADDRCIAGLHAVLPPGAGLVLYQEEIGTVGNNFIAAAPGHEVLVRAFALGMAAVARGDEDTVWLSTGPGLLTRALAETLARAGDGWAKRFPGVVILGRRDLMQAVAIHCTAAYKTTEAHWSNAPKRPRNK